MIRTASLLLSLAFFSAVQSQTGSGDVMSGSGDIMNNGSDISVTATDGSDMRTDDSLSPPLSMEAVIGIAVGGGVVLVTCLIITCVCMVCCIWRRGRGQKSEAIYVADDGDDHRSSIKSKSTSPHSTLSNISHTIARKLLSHHSREEKHQELIRDSDLTTTIISTDCSNPLYHSASIHPPSSDPHTQEHHPTLHSGKDTQILSVEPPVMSSSPRRHSLGYVEMQSAGSALLGIVSSQSVGDFEESARYDSVKERGFVTLPTGMSYSPPPSPLANNLPETRHLFLHTTNPTPSPISPTPHPHTPHKTDEEEEEEDRDDYEDPKLFIEDREKVDMEQDKPEVLYDEVEIETNSDIIFTQNRAHLSSYSEQGNQHLSGDHTSPSLSTNLSRLTPVSETASDKPSYENVDSEDAYLSDGYEHVSEYVNDQKPEGSDALIEREQYDVSSRKGLSHTASNPQLKENGVGVHRALEQGETLSLDRRLSLDNQYVEVSSPARKAHSVKIRSRVVRESIGSDTPELDYQNLPPGMGIRERGSESESKTAATSLTVNVSPSRDVNKSPTTPGTDQKRPDTKSPVPRGNTKSPVPVPRTDSKSPVPRGNTKSPIPLRDSKSPVQRGDSKSPVLRGKSNSPKPKVKPKPNLPQSPGPKPRSKSTDPVLQSSVRVQLVSAGEETKLQNRPHLEEMTFPARAVANGNGLVANGNRPVAKGNGAVAKGNGESRTRAVTTPISSDVISKKEGDRGSEGGDEEDVFYVNVADVGGVDLYQNVTHLT